MRDHHSILLLEKMNFQNLQGGRSSEACHVLTQFWFSKSFRRDVKRDGAIYFLVNLDLRIFFIRYS